MPLDINQINGALEHPEKRQVIRKAVSLQFRHRFHTETNVVMSDINAPASLFIDWVKTLLPKDKFDTFIHLFRFPLSTPSVVGECYKGLERVFDSRNASSTYQFTDSELAEDWSYYRQTVLKEPNIWRTEGWKRMQVSANSILVVDLPTEQRSSRPEPYFYWLEISEVIDYRLVNGSNVQFEWLIFRQPEHRIAVFDDTTIRVFQLNDKNQVQSLVSEAVHNLGYCPARFFWSAQLNERNPDLKSNPITPKLSDLDWLLFFSQSKRHLDLYAPYPIYSAYQADCDFENNETGDYCDGGFLRNSKGEYKLLSDGTVERCPICSAKRTVGPGSFLEVPVPNQQEGVADMRSPVQITSIDRDALDYNVDECVRLKEEIITAITGSGTQHGNVSDKEAVNEVQIAANFADRTSVLNSLKVNFEAAQKFVDDTICRFRYGGAFISSSINWGTEFYVFTVAELYDKYNKAKEAGLSEAELDAISQQLIEVEYKNNPLLLQRMQILKHLEPYPHKTFDEVLDLYSTGLIKPEMLILKLNFSSFIDRFERDNMNIIEFGANVPMSSKIRTINNKLLEYAREQSYNTAGQVINRAGFATGRQNTGGAQ